LVKPHKSGEKPAVRIHSCRKQPFLWVLLFIVYWRIINKDRDHGSTGYGKQQFKYKLDNNNCNNNNIKRLFTTFNLA